MTQVLTPLAVSANEPKRPKRLVWLDCIKGLALLWIMLAHAADRWFGSPLIFNPSGDWSDLPSRISQLRPIDMGGPLADVIMNVVRWAGWLGDAGVGPFLVAAGYGLTLGRLSRPVAKGRLLSEYRARFARIYPLWWLAHAAFLLGPAIIGWRVSLADSQFWFSLIGIRVTPSQLYYGVPAWWFIGLILQLPLVCPLVWGWGRRPACQT
jgi:peptidoglycan/LPS O-acetylase OafA/YrhL